MFAASSLRASAKVHNYQSITKLLGRATPATATVQAYSAIVEDAKADPQAALLARLGRAACLISRGDAALALEDVAVAAAAPGAASASALIAGLRIGAYTAQLNVEARKRTLSGASDEALMSTLTQHVQDALYAEGIPANNWSVKLSTAEFELNHGINTNGKAADLFAQTAAAIQAEARAVNTKNSAAASVEATAAFEDKVDAAAVSKAIGGTLTAEQAKLLATVASAAQSANTAIDVSAYPLSAQVAFRPWTSSKAACAINDIDSLSEATSGFMTTIQGDVQKIGQCTQSNNLAAAAAASAPAGTHVLKHVAAQCGATNTGSASESDRAFHNVMNGIEARFTKNANASAQQQGGVIASLLAQAEARALSGRAEALEKDGALTEALAIAEGIIKGDQYIDMWRPLLLKGRVQQKLGQVAESDATFKALHALKQQYRSNDIPLVDENRFKTSF